MRACKRKTLCCFCAVILTKSRSFLLNVTWRNTVSSKQMDLINSRCFVEKQKGGSFLFRGRDAGGNSEDLEVMFGLCDGKECVQALWNNTLFS